MKAKNLKLLVTIGFGIVQIFWIFWFFVRAAYAYVMMILDWQQNGMPLDHLAILTFELVWVGILPFIIICLAKGFLKRMIDKKLFSQESYKISLRILILTGLVVLSSLLQDFFYYQESCQDLISFIDQYIFQYMGAYLILLILLVLVFVIKNGISVQEDVDGII